MADKAGYTFKHFASVEDYARSRRLRAQALRQEADLLCKRAQTMEDEAGELEAAMIPTQPSPTTAELLRAMIVPEPAPSPEPAPGPSRSDRPART
jgi:hypothetical protein